MSRRDWIKASSLILIILFCGLYTRRTLLGPQIEGKPNLMVISMCSFRYKLLSTYTGAKEIITPAMDDFIRNSSFYFTNAMNGMPWVAMFSVAESMLPVHEIMNYGYVTQSNNTSDYMFRVPGRRSWLYPANYPVDDSDFEKNHQAETNYIQFLATHGPRPFFLITHYKYMHYPLIDRFNADSQWDFYMTTEERQQIAEYLNHPEKYPEKMPFLLMLSNDERVPMSHPQVKALGGFDDPWQRIKVKGLLTDPGLLKTWENSPGFKSDLALLEKAYAGNARYLDRVIAPALDLWGDSELQNNTVVVLSGDHGEMHMEHGILSHGNALYEEGLRVPLAIRFPGQTRPVKIDEQMNFRMLSTLIHGIVKGTVDGSNFERMLAKVEEESLVLRDCVNTRRGLRYKNDYKYIFDLAEDRAYLYDLKNDPGEMHDIAPQHPDLVERFEKQFWQLYPTYTRIDPGGCFTWVPSAEG